MKTSTILAALLLSATFASAGDLKPVHGANDGVKPVHESQGAEHANENSALIDPEKAKDDKVRKLRPVK